MEILFHLQCWLWQSIMMEIGGDLCEWEKIQGNLLGDNTLPPFPPPRLSLSSPRVTRQSACVWGRGATMCWFSRECRQSVQPPLHLRGEEGERRRETGGKPLHSTPLVPRFPPSLSHYLFLSLSTLPLIILSLCLSGSHTHSGMLTSQLPTRKWQH